MAKFELISGYKPTGDQPQAIKELTEGILRGDKYQTLFSVTGSGKTYTMANVIANVGKPALVLSHNKTLAAQLYGEFKSFFPNNAVEHFAFLIQRFIYGNCKWPKFHEIKMSCYSLKNLIYLLQSGEII